MKERQRDSDEEEQFVRIAFYFFLPPCYFVFYVSNDDDSGEKARKLFHLEQGEVCKEYKISQAQNKKSRKRFSKAVAPCLSVKIRVMKDFTLKGEKNESEKKLFARCQSLLMYAWCRAERGGRQSVSNLRFPFLRLLVWGRELLGK